MTKEDTEGYCFERFTSYQSGRPEIRFAWLRGVRIRDNQGKVIGVANELVADLSESGKQMLEIMRNSLVGQASVWTANSSPDDQNWSQILGYSKIAEDPGGVA